MPESLWKQIIELAHEGHQGMVRTTARLREKVWWPRMDKQVEEVVRACHPCQLVGPRAKPEPVKSTRLPEGPSKEISIDLLDVSSDEHLLVEVDYDFRWIEAILFKRIDAHMWLSLWKLSSGHMAYQNVCVVIMDHHLHQNSLKLS